MSNFTSTGNFTVPANVVANGFEVLAGGGGGGGGGGATLAVSGGGGGGGGASVGIKTTYVPVTGDVLNIIIAGGAGTAGALGVGFVGGDGGDGGSTIVKLNGGAVICSGLGGKHGTGETTTTPGQGGLGAAAGIGDVTSAGTNGANGVNFMAQGGAGGIYGGGNGGTGGNVAATAGQAGGAPEATVTYFTSTDCTACDFAAGLVMGLKPDMSTPCQWVNCQTVTDDSCPGDAMHYAITSVLSFSGSDVLLTISADRGQTVVYSLAVASWSCNGSNVMSFVSQSNSACNWPATLTVSGTDSSVCVPHPYYSYYFSSPVYTPCSFSDLTPPSTCGLPRTVHATFTNNGGGPGCPLLDGLTFALPFYPAGTSIPLANGLGGAQTFGCDQWANVITDVSSWVFMGLYCDGAHWIFEFLWSETALGWCVGSPCATGVFLAASAICNPLDIEFPLVFARTGDFCFGPYAGSACIFTNSWSVAVTE